MCSVLLESHMNHVALVGGLLGHLIVQPSFFLSLDVVGIEYADFGDVDNQHLSLLHGGKGPYSCAMQFPDGALVCIDVAHWCRDETIS